MSTLHTHHTGLAQAQPLRTALLRAQVHVLGRMGAAGRALQLIIGRLADVPAAIAFVQSQADEELWQHLIQLALQDPESTGGTPPSMFAVQSTMQNIVW